MPCPLLIFSQSEYLIQIFDTNSHTEWQTVQIQISWLKPTDLELHCFKGKTYLGSDMYPARTRGNVFSAETQLTLAYSVLIFCNLIYMGHTKQKKPSNMCKMYRFWPFCTGKKYHYGLCPSFTHSAVWNDSVSRQWRPWLDSADA